METRMTSTALKRSGLTEAQAVTLAKVKAGRDITGGMAGVALERKGLFRQGVGHVPGGLNRYELTAAGEATLAQLRRNGW